jgi:AMMECR1 domain-containing protein
LTDYSKAAIDHALTALSVETEQEVEEILQDSYTAFFKLNDILHKMTFRLRDTAGLPEMREKLAAVVLYAATMLYEWDKSRKPSLPAQ